MTRGSGTPVGTSLAITIKPPFWSTWWFRVVGLLALVSGTLAVIRIRTDRIRKRNLELKEEVAERRMAEEQIRAALHEKEILLKEVHHRVKNNLQVICSLLNLQANDVADPAVRAYFDESRNRVRSMALVHEKLYGSANLASINFDEYLVAVTDELRRSFHVGRSHLFR